MYASISNRQEQYNAIVEKYNTTVGTFPNVLFASILGLKRADFIGQDDLDKAIELGEITDIDDIDII